MTMTTTTATPVPFAKLPAPNLLPPPMRKLAAELGKLYDRLDALTVAGEALHAPEAHAKALDADRDAQADAIRAGRPASTAGTPATDALAAARTENITETEAVVVAIVKAQRDAIETAVALLADEDASGRNAAREAVARYRDVVEKLTTARTDVLDALRLPTFLTRISYGAAPVPETIPFDLENRTLPIWGESFDRHAPIPIAAVQRKLSEEADDLAALVTDPKW